MTSTYITPWRIDVTIRDAVIDAHGGRRPIASAPLARAVAAALDAAGAPAPASVGLILADDDELTSLNKAHLGHEGATDVLSFPLLPAEGFPSHAGDPDRGPEPRTGDAAFFAGPPGRRVHLGDIVVSVERAREQAEHGRGGQTGDVRWSTADELRLLVTHGALHLCGWDHADPAERSAMRDLEHRLLAVGS
ncbi:MAG TPA: rRNA maturation RNase YbeY [Patescibacteria group bacterium]|nr:rRNA maturation RNase YbeY [Patescibacteria group bacterium]